MFDARLRPIIDPPLNRLGRGIASLGVRPDGVTLAGLVVGLAAAAAIGFEAHGLAFALILVNRLLDGLDGAVARATSSSDFGGYIDIVADFIFYVAVPVGFGFADPANLPAAMLLVATFALTGTSFLAFAILAAKRGIETDAHGKKSFFYNSGLAEGTETILFFLIATAFPNLFPLAATIYAGLCVLTVLQRSWNAWRTFR